MHNKITNFATSVQQKLTAVEERLDARIDNLASDHNQLVSYVSVLSDCVDKVTTGAGGSLHTTITDSTGAAFSSVAVVPSETGNDNAPLRTPGDYAPLPVRHLLHSTMVSAPGRVRYTSETVPTLSHKSPIFHWEIRIIFLIYPVPEIIFVQVMCVNQLAVCLVAMARLIMGCIDPMCIMNLFHMHHLFRLKIWTWFQIQILIAHSQIQFLKHLVHQRHLLVLIVLVSIIHVVLHLWEWKNRLLKCQLLIPNQITGQLSFSILKVLWMKWVGRDRKSLNWNFASLVIPKKFLGLYLHLFKEIMKLWKINFSQSMAMLMSVKLTLSSCIIANRVMIKIYNRSSHRLLFWQIRHFLMIPSWLILWLLSISWRAVNIKRQPGQWLVLIVVSL